MCDQTPHQVNGNLAPEPSEEELQDDATRHPFDQLTPDTLIDAIESVGFLCDGRMLALNSYENRVYQIGIDEQDPIIAKFYRPARWSNEQILEEHQFTHELADAELPVVAPLIIKGQSLFEYQGFRFGLYPRQGGHAPELDNMDHLLMIGRLMGRIHASGASSTFLFRNTLKIEQAIVNRDYLLNSVMPSELHAAYASITNDLFQSIQTAFKNQYELQYLRSHGDCHIGNMLWRNDTPHFVDFDDCCMAPAIQDIWMLLSGDRPMQTSQLSEIIDGYNEFYDFPLAQLPLIEPLRTLRLINYSAWLAQRWSDPAFPRNFPWFNTIRYWSDHILELREQQSALQEPALKIY